MSKIPLGSFVHARSGDKGGDANLGLWVSHTADRREERTAWLLETVTADWVREHVPGLEITAEVTLGDPGKLLRMATTIGVGDSMRFLRKQKNVFARIALPGFSSTTFVHKVARLATDERLGIRGLHVYTFNQVARTESWRQEQLDLISGGHPGRRARPVGP